MVRWLHPSFVPWSSPSHAVSLNAEPRWRADVPATAVGNPNSHRPVSAEPMGATIWVPTTGRRQTQSNRARVRQVRGSTKPSSSADIAPTSSTPDSLHWKRRCNASRRSPGKPIGTCARVRSRAALATASPIRTMTCQPTGPQRRRRSKGRWPNTRIAGIRASLFAQRTHLSRRGFEIVPARRYRVRRASVRVRHGRRTARPVAARFGIRPRNPSLFRGTSDRLIDWPVEGPLCKGSSCGTRTRSFIRLRLAILNENNSHLFAMNLFPKD